MLFKLDIKFLVKLFLIILSQHVIIVKLEFYSSIHEMSKLVEYESVFLENMQKFVTVNENKLEFLKARLGDFERDCDEARLEGSAYFDSPVNKYLLTKRLTVDWERIENVMDHNSGKKSLNKIERHINQHPIPDNNELIGAVEGILRLQDIYRFRTKDIAAGLLGSVKYATELEARHCFDIGKHAKQLGQLRLAHSWLIEALERLNAKSKHANSALVEEPLDRSTILTLLADTKHKLGDFKGANETYTELIELKPEIESAVKAYSQFLELTEDSELATLDLSEEHEPIPDNILASDEFERYKYTCNGAISPSPSEERELRCGFLTETHPFLIIAPIKVEELNHDPLLVIYYDVITDKEIAVMHNLTNHKISRATVMGSERSEVSLMRTSQFVFMPASTHPVLQTIDERVEDMSNLNMRYAEDHQFQNYGIGGHYAQHWDFFLENMMTPDRVSSPELGNRIGTVLFYLSDVEQGGGTAFPYLKRLLMPKKGAAAFWHNLHAAGSVDERTLHGGCPIIVGSKWVLNRWIRENIQSDRRPCEVYDDKVNGPF